MRMSAFLGICLIAGSQPCAAAQSEGSLLPVIPQPAEWKRAQGECDLANAKVTSKVDKETGLGEEGYTMSIAPDSIRIVAGGDVGAVWARQTLAQLKAHGGAAPPMRTKVNRQNRFGDFRIHPMPDFCLSPIRSDERLLSPLMSACIL